MLSFSCGHHPPLLVSNMTNNQQHLSAVFHALSDPTRRGMLATLASSPRRVGELAEPTGLRLPTVMRHLAVLEEAGMVRSRKEGRTRICSIAPEALGPAIDWLDQQRGIWEARLDRLDEFVTGTGKE